MIGDWIVTFEFARQPRRVQTPFERQWEFNDIKDGFWITHEHQLCAESQGTYWIPPSRIIMIERVGAEKGAV